MTLTVKCAKCGAPMQFVKMAESGKKMPVNPTRVFIAPDPEGKTLIVTEAGEAVRGRELSLDDAAQATEVRSGHVSHFATCAHAAEFRKVNVK